MRHRCRSNDSIVDCSTRYATFGQAENELSVGASIKTKVWLTETQPEKFTNHPTGAAVWRWKPRQNGIGFKGTVVDQSSAII